MALVVASCDSSDESRTIPSLPPPTEATTTTTGPTTTTTVADDPDVSTTTTTPDEPADDRVRLAVGDDFQEAVDGSEPGTTFVIESGVHRMQEVRPRDGMTFEGEPGAVMAGAIELSDWSAEGDGVWATRGISPTGQRAGQCIGGYSGCSFSQDLYMDDVMLWQVTDRSDLEPGTWLWEGATIYVADDPGSRRVELSVAEHAFFGVASDVTIRDLTVEKYAAPAQSGAIHASAPGNFAELSSGWLIEDVEVRLNHGAGIRLGDATTVRRANIHHNGQLGLVANEGSGSLVEDSEVAFNNIAGFRWGWEAGGSKFKRTTGLVIRDNFVHSNNGPGLWTDIENYDTLYEGNTVSDNTGPGIFHEVSYGAQIRDNTVTGNSVESAKWLWGSGILVAASADVEVYDNTVTGNGDGISGIQQNRGQGPEGERLLANLHVHSNTISLGDGEMGVVEDTGDDAVFDRNNRFESNTYLDVEGERYAWDGDTLDRRGWQAAGQDLNGTWRETTDVEAEAE